jgi:hypothetical protein
MDRGFRMTLEECKKCDFHKNYENGAVHCGYDRNIVSFATVFNPSKKDYILLSRPKERK